MLLQHNWSALMIAAFVAVSTLLPVTWCTEQLQQQSTTEATLHQTVVRNRTKSRHRGCQSGRERNRERSSTIDNAAMCEMEITCGGGQHDDFTSIRLPVRMPIEVPHHGVGRDGHASNISSTYVSGSSARGATVPAKVAFFAGLSTNIGPVTENSPVLFDRIVTNFGDAYDGQTGRFTAPVNGTYQFSVVISAQGRQKAAVNVVKNGEMVVTVWAESIPYWASATSVAILDLEPADQVWLILLNRASYLHGYMYSTFSGFLIFEH